MLTLSQSGGADYAQPLALPHIQIYCDYAPGQGGQIMSTTLLLAPLLDFQTFYKPLVNVSAKIWVTLTPGPSRFRRPCSHSCSIIVFVHTYLIVKIHSLLGTSNDVKNASMRTYVLTGTYRGDIDDKTSEKYAALSD